MINWQPLEQELALWEQEKKTAPLWWRDDDCIEPTPALTRLLQQASEFSLPLGLAIIPANISPELANSLAPYQGQVVALQHGFNHQNYADAGQRKCELGYHRPLPDIMTELNQGKTLLDNLLGPQFKAVLVPPWNRLRDDLPTALAEAGFIGLSCYGPVKPEPLLQCHNVHVDLINSKTRQFAGSGKVIEQLTQALAQCRQADSNEAIGIMTHHLVMDEPGWDFIHTLLERLHQDKRVQWPTLEALF